MKVLYTKEGLEDKLISNEYNSEISNIQNNILKKIPKSNDITPISSRIEYRDGCHKRAVIFLTTNGCDWALSRSGGCTMCGHLEKHLRTNKEIIANDIITQFDSSYDKINFNEISVLNLYNNGSFFNENEIPIEARIYMLKKVGENNKIKSLVVESRPEYINAEVLKESKELLPNINVEIAVGLEVKDDLYRKIYLNKGFNLKQYERASNIIRQFFDLRTYVFLKPPFLSERESINEAIRTINYAFENGAGTVSLESCTVQKYTLIKQLYDSKTYTPPWLWSILEVVKAVHKSNDKLIIGTFQFYPSPEMVPYNCKTCSNTVLKAIVNYNKYSNISIFNNLHCECKKKWKLELDNKNHTIEEALNLHI